MKKSTSGWSPTASQELKETTSWTTVGQAKDIASMWKLYVEAVIQSEARPKVLHVSIVREYGCLIE